MPLPAIIPNKHLTAICRFYLQEVSPNFQLYVSPINSDPSDSALQITEPPEFIKEISDRLGLFYTTGFQEDHKALSNKIFTDDEYRIQADIANFWSMLWKTMMMACCSFTFPARTYSHICSGGIRT